MSDPFGNRPFPRGALLAAGALVAVVFIAAASGRLTGVGVVATPAAPPAYSRELRFEDRDDGAVVVIDPADGAVVDVLAPGTNGFVRGVLRGMARERRSMGIGAGPPFRLERSANGLLTLVDPAVGRRISLDPFGPTNAGAFARLLHDSPPAMSRAGNDTNDDQEG